MPVLPTRKKLSTLVAALALVALAPITGAQAKVLKKPSWVSKVTITEYYPVPEWWFVGARVNTPGLDRKSRIDWLYSARGVSMEGDGIGLDGKAYHIASVGSSGWWVDTIVVSSAGGPPSAASVTPVPTIGEYALLALMALVAGAAAFGRRHRA